MDNVELIISVIQAVFCLIFLGSIAWGATRAFKLKGFIVSVSLIFLIFLSIIFFEKILDWSIVNNPIFILIMLVVMALFLLGVTYFSLKEQFKKFAKNKDIMQIRNSFIKTSLKQLFFVILFSIFIFGIIFFLVVASEF